MILPRRRNALAGLAAVVLLCAIAGLAAAAHSKSKVRLTFVCFTNDVASQEVRALFVVENQLKQSVGIAGGSVEKRERGWHWYSAASFEKIGPYKIGNYPPGRNLLVAQLPSVEGRYRLVLPWYPVPWVSPTGAGLRLRLASFLESHDLVAYKWRWRLHGEHFVESNAFQGSKGEPLGRRFLGVSSNGAAM